MYPVLRALEESGAPGAAGSSPGSGPRSSRCRARSTASARSASGDAGAGGLLAATDPGAAVRRRARLARDRRPAEPERRAHTSCSSTANAAFLERGAKTLVTFGADPRRWADALAALVKDGRVRRIELRQIDGIAAGDHPAAAVLCEVGFADGYRGLTLRG